MYCTYSEVSVEIDRNSLLFVKWYVKFSFLQLFFNAHGSLNTISCPNNLFLIKIPFSSAQISVYKFHEIISFFKKSSISDFIEINIFWTYLKWSYLYHFPFTNVLHKHFRQYFGFACENLEISHVSPRKPYCLDKTFCTRVWCFFLSNAYFYWDSCLITAAFDSRIATVRKPKRESSTWIWFLYIYFNQISALLSLS